MFGKRGQIWETIPPWVILVIFLVIMLIVYGLFSERLGSIGQYIKDFFRFGR